VQTLQAQKLLGEGGSTKTVFSNRVTKSIWAAILTIAVTLDGIKKAETHSLLISENEVT
jgi:hypothetical protein